uniref:Uncharacterized protein n=1 Tax=Ciona savignyi TaxID=51511 RepID=H2YT12_CIOSA
MHRLVSIDRPTTPNTPTGLTGPTGPTGPTSALMNYKLMFGTLMEMAAKFISKYLQSTSNCTINNVIDELAENTWTAYLNLCYACIRTKKEPIAKLGCSCLRHMISCNSSHMTSRMIDDLCTSLPHAIENTLHQLTTLTSEFADTTSTSDGIIVEFRDSHSEFCSSPILSRVFQSSSVPQKSDPQEINIVIPTKKNQPETKILLGEVACDLSSSQLLLQCVEQILLGDNEDLWSTPGIPPTPDTNDPQTTSATTSLHSTSEGGTTTNEESTSTRIRSKVLHSMSSSQVHDLATSVAKVYVAARNFDSRPKLQRLMQKLVK